MTSPYIKMEGIAKNFGPVQALKSVNLEIYTHEILIG
jgi:D-allose transport system ATP-binding protein